MARSLVARALVERGNPEYRQGVITDNGNIILDVHDMLITNPQELEFTIKFRRCDLRLIRKTPCGYSVIGVSRQHTEICALK